jgi:hypothetical protein
MIDQLEDERKQIKPIMRIDLKNDSTNIKPCKHNQIEI